MQILTSYAINELQARLGKDSPALAGTVQGVVVHMARHKSGKNSSNNPSEVGGALTTLNMAYMLFETWPSGYCRKNNFQLVNQQNDTMQILKDRTSS
jgi:hypothetical protein